MVKYIKKSFSLSDLWVSSHERLTDFYASSWQRGDSPVPLLVVRLVLTAASLGILVWSVTVAPSPYWLIYLTNWGLVLVAAVTLSGFFVSVCAVMKKIPDEGEPPWYVSTYWLLFNIAVPIAIVITLLYWILLFDPDARDNPDHNFWLETVTHGFNTLLVLIELLASRTPVRVVHIYQSLGVGLWYAVFTGIYYGAGGTDSLGNPWIYEILDWRSPGPTAALVSASVFGLIGVYLGVWTAAYARDKLTGTFIRTRSHDLPFTPPEAV